MLFRSRSIVANRSEFEYFLSQKATLPDIVCIQETFLNKTDTVFNIDGYTMERVDRESGTRGGVATLIRLGLSYTRLRNPTSLEAVVVRVKLRSGNEKLMDDHNMVALNTGAGTYLRRTGEQLSHLDVAMATTNIARVANWMVSDETMGSDHFLIEITLN